MAEDVQKLVNRGLISRKSYASSKKQKHSKFAKRAGHNPPKPEFAVSEVRDRYGNVYTTDPDYVPGPTSPLPAYRPPPRAAAPRATDAARAKPKPKPKPKAADTVPLPRPRPESTFATRPVSGEPTFATRPPPISHPFGTADNIAGRWTGYPADTAPALTGAAPAYAETPPAAVPLPATYAPAMPSVPLPQPRPAMPAAPAGSYGGGSMVPQQNFPLPQATQDFLARLLGMFGR